MDVNETTLTVPIESEIMGVFTRKRSAPPKTIEVTEPSNNSPVPTPIPILPRPQNMMMMVPVPSMYFMPQFQQSTSPTENETEFAAKDFPFIPFMAVPFPYAAMPTYVPLQMAKPAGIQNQISTSEKPVPISRPRGRPRKIRAFEHDQSAPGNVLRSGTHQKFPIAKLANQNSYDTGHLAEQNFTDMALINFPYPQPKKRGRKPNIGSKANLVAPENIKIESLQSPGLIFAQLNGHPDQQSPIDYCIKDKI